ncbi:MAG: hypothetical protein PHE88_00825 [Elusimicrobia bacterium]|nr:hypothetical protein [Elusimicrobiota bacterium]
MKYHFFLDETGDLINPKEPYIPFNIIEEKIYCDKKGKYDGWGLKLFP